MTVGVGVGVDKLYDGNGGGELTGGGGSDGGVGWW